MVLSWEKYDMIYVSKMAGWLVAGGGDTVGRYGGGAAERIIGVNLG